MVADMDMELAGYGAAPDCIQVSSELLSLGGVGRAEVLDVLALAAAADKKKVGEEERAEGFAYASCGMRGWRETMEDAHLTLPFGYIGGGWRDAALFGVFDGHGGEQVSRYVARRLPIVLAQLPSEKPEAAFTTAFRQLDEALRSPSAASDLAELTMEGNPIRDSAERCGSTAVCCLLRGSELVVAHSGDSRAVLCRQGKAIELTQDHKPIMPVELARITKAGGMLVQEALSSGGEGYRVDGDLNLSRALGDFKYKDIKLKPHEQMISGVPDTSTLALEPDKDEFIILACDGVWECISSQEAVNFVRARLPPPGTKKGLMPVLGQLLDSCCATTPKQRGGLGCDNITAVLIRFESAAEVAAADAAAVEEEEEVQVSDAQRRRQEAALSAAIQRLSDNSRRRKESPEEKAEREAQEKEEREEMERRMKEEEEQAALRRKRKEEREANESNKKKRVQCCAFDEEEDDDDEDPFA